MELLKEKILKSARVLEGDVLKVDHFLSQQIDISLLESVAEEFCRLFADTGITKVLTIESTGIAVSALTAARLGVPMVYAKKAKRGSAGEHLFAAALDTPTLGQEVDIVLPKEYVEEGDRFLVLDDFLAKGNTLIALLTLAKQTGAEIVGCGVIIEKLFSGGSDLIRDMGIRLEALAKIESMSVTDGIKFAE